MELKNFFQIFWFVLVGFVVVSPQECGRTGSFVPGDRYDTNRGLILSSLASKVSAQGGFFNGSIGQGPDQVYALGMCIQGAEPEVCSKCIDQASNGLLDKCPNQTEGLNWPQVRILCMVRYSSSSFFGSLKAEPHFHIANQNNIIYNSTVFDQVWGDLARRMIASATSPSSKRKYYAADTAPLTASFQIIYALMQCTPDLSLEDCYICLRQSVADYEACCHGKQGGIVYRASCVFRWELFPFSEAFSRINTKAKKGSELVSIGSSRAIVIPTAKRTHECYYRVAGSSTELTATHSLQFDFKAIEAATNKFSESNLIGRGGFGDVFKAWRLWINGSTLELVDPAIRRTYQSNEVTRCIHIALLCIQENPDDRPLLSNIILMLSSNTSTLPVPCLPGFFSQSRQELVHASEGSEFSDSTGRSTPYSSNDMSITDLEPR
ncbi:hypothetical protein Bca4012_009200 [Brassica carinata]